VVKTIGASAATTTPASATFSVEFDTDVWGWDPVIGTELIVYQSASATAGGVVVGEKVTLTSANITSVTSKKFEFSTPSVAFAAGLPYVWVEIPAGVAGKNSAPSGATLPAATVGPILVYTMVGTAGAQAASTTANQITGPVAKSATTNRTFNVSAQVNIVDDEAATPAAINAAFGVNDDFVLQIKDGATVIGSQKFRKPTITPATGTANRQIVQATIDSPFTVGVHSLTAVVLDPIGRTASTSAAAPVLVWDAPVVADVNGIRAPESTPTVFTIDRTNAIEIIGSNFSVGAFTSTVAAVMDPATTATALTDSSTDPTKFKFTLASLPQGTHTLEVTQTYTGTPSISPAPTIVRTYTIENGTAVLDVVAPTVVIATPANNSTITVLRPKVTGITEAGATVDARFSADGITWTDLDQVTADASGNFSFDNTSGDDEWDSDTLATNTSYYIQVRATDKAGNVLPWADITASNPPGQTRVTTASSAVNTALSATSNLTGSGAIKYSTGANPTLTLAVTAPDGTTLAGGTMGTGTNALTASDFTVTGGTATLSGFVLTVTPTAQGNVTIALPKDAFTINGVGNEAMPTYTFIRDNVAPTFTAKITGVGTSTTAINLAAGTKIVLTANEDIDASSLDKTKITIAAVGTAGSFAAPTLDAGVLATNKRTITFTSTTTITQGTATGIGITFAAGVIKDIAGNNAALLPATGTTPVATATFDIAALDITSITSTAVVPAGKVSPMPFVFTFTKAVNDFGLEDLDITNGIATTLTGAGTATYNLSVVPGEGPTPVKVAIKSATVVKDLVGTTLSITGTTNGKHLLTRVYDSTPPSVLSLTSSTPAPTATDLKPTNLTSIPCTIVFSEPLATALKASDLTVAGGSVSSVSGDGSVFSFNVDVSPANDAHKVSVLLAEKKVSDSVANQNSSVAVLVRNFDRDLPVITASAPAPTGSTTTSESKAAFAFTVTGNAGGTTDCLLSTFDKSKISMSPAIGSIESITTTDDSGSPAKITGFTVNVVYQRNTGGNVIVTAAPGTITDRAGNKNVSTASTLLNPSNG